VGSDEARGTSVGDFSSLFESIVANVGRVLHGKEAAVRLALICLISEGHLLVEDVPGVGKTNLAKALARSVQLQWRRIQFTPDLLPSDVIGSSIYDRNSSSFSFRPGAVFSNILLGDEINRASPKTQSALLEAMEERQVTVDATTYPLPSPFLVIATQNPVEHEGTYALPESQIDRFLLRIHLGYPDRGSEITMLERHGGPAADDLSAVADASELAMMMKVAATVYIAPPLRAYVVDLARATRAHHGLTLGMSPRATIAMQSAARTLAASCGRDYVVPDDIKALVPPVVAHRLVLSDEAQLDGLDVEQVLGDVLASVAVPSGRSRA